MSIGRELLNVPMGDMIRQMAFAIAEAQIKLDESSIEVAEMMGGLRTVYDDEGNIAFDDSRIFFGHEYMTPSEADSLVALDPGYGEIVTAAKKHQTDNGQIRVPTRLSMLELGFTPVFYNFVDTIIEVKIAIKITRSSERSSTSSNKTTKNSASKKGSGLFGKVFGGRDSNRASVSTSQVDASYASKYSYSAEGSSLLRTKLSPVPPPPILEERIRAMMEEAEARRQPAPAPEDDD